MFCVVICFIVDRVDLKLGDKVFDFVCGIGGFLVCLVDYVKLKYVNIVVDYKML